MGNQPPDGLLADPEVGIVGSMARLLRRQHDARAEPQLDQPVEGAQLRLRQWMGLVVSGDDPARRGQRIGLAQHDVGQRDRQIPDREADDDVAEIDDSDHTVIRRRKRPLIGHQQIVVIEVVMDRAPPQLSKQGLCLNGKAAQRLVDPLAEQRIFDQSAMALDHLPPPRQIPVQLAMDRRMVKIGQAPIELPEAPPQISEQAVRVVSHLGQRPPRQKRDQPEKVDSWLAVAGRKRRQRCLVEPFPRQGRADPGSDLKRTF